MIPLDLKTRLELDSGLLIREVSRLVGGDINSVYKLETSDGAFVLKLNHGKPSNFFTAEADGLRLLQSTDCIRIPNCLLVGEHNEHQYILLEYISPGHANDAFWKRLGKQLAILHSNSDSFFGFDKDNYIGSLAQRNSPHSTWHSFFFGCRVLPLIDRAINKGLLNTGHLRVMQKIEQAALDFFPESKPALIHGDLWSGNIICTDDQMPCLIDPAVYYGHPEMEIAFTRLFGGFPMEFYDSYWSVNPKVNGFEERVDLYNLYPLLVHLLLFGNPYKSRVESVINKFSNLCR